VYIDGFQKPYVIPIKARPATPKLQFPSEISFGVVPVVKNALQKGKTPGEKVKFDFGHAGVVCKYFHVANEGGKELYCDVQWDRRASIRVTPTHFHLAGKEPNGVASSVELKVEFLPHQAGDVVTELRLKQGKPDRRRPNGTAGKGSRLDLFASNMSLASAPFSSVANLASHSVNQGAGDPGVSLLGVIEVKAHVLDRQLQLKDDNDNVLNTTNLDFGTIFSNEIAVIRARVVNLGPSSVRWVSQHFQKT
jgi:hypothetical protein